MNDQITLFSLPVLTWDLTDSWDFTDPYGRVIEEDNPYGRAPSEKFVREWHRECPHTEMECAPPGWTIQAPLGEVREDCGTPIGWGLVSEFLARAKVDNIDDGE